MGGEEEEEEEERERRSAGWAGLALVSKAEGGAKKGRRVDEVVVVVRPSLVSKREVVEGEAEGDLSLLVLLRVSLLLRLLLVVVVVVVVVGGVGEEGMKAKGCLILAVVVVVTVD